MYFVEIPILLHNDLIGQDVKRPGGIDFEKFEAWAVTESEGKERVIIYLESGNEFMTGLNESKFKDWLFETIASYNAFFDDKDKLVSA